MGPDPKPYQPVFPPYGEGPVIAPDPDGPKSTDLFQMEGRVTCILFEEVKVCVREVLNISRELPVARPESG